MRIQHFIPSARLQPYIKQYYMAEGNFTQNTYDVFFADGCLEAVFNLDLDFYRGNEKEHWAKVIGQITQPLHVKAKGTGKSFGVWFYPHGFCMFSNLPVRELTDRAVPLDLVFDKHLTDLVGNCLVHNEMAGLIDGVNTYFESILRKDSRSLKNTIAEYAVKSFTNSPRQLELDELARRCNVSSRYLQKIFLEKIGLSPKQFQQVLRFQQTLAHLNTFSDCALTKIAYENGYFDQSHFIREFKRFAGFTPSQYQLENHPINQYFLFR